VSEPFAEAEKYESWFRKGFGRKAFNLERELFERHFPKNVSEVLDIGCGTGIWMEVAEEMGLRVFGVDASMEMLSLALKKGLRNLARADATELPFRDDSFGASMFITSLEFIENRKRAMEEALRVSRNYVVVCFLNKLSTLSVYRLLKARVKRSIYRRARFLTPDELMGISKSVNFKGKNLKPVLSRGTIRLAAGNFLIEEVERRIPDSAPFPSFIMTIFEVVRE